jgi:3-oxoacyl-[acyl-carrier protein] reductase
VARFDGRVAVVTGAATGLGEAYARALASEGAAVVVADRDGDGTGRVARSIAEGGGSALAVTADVADESSVDRMVETATSAFGGVDVLVNNAAVMFRGLHPPRRAFWEFTAGEMDMVLRVNVTGSWLCARAVLPSMRRRGGGRIVNISSNMAFGTDLPWPARRAPYTTSKAAVIGLTRALAGELGEYHITVNAVAPGVVPTETVEEHVGSERLAASSMQQALHRVASTDDIVGVVLFLCSEESRWVTGQTIVVDGGLMC